MKKLCSLLILILLSMTAAACTDPTYGNPGSDQNGQQPGSAGAEKKALFVGTDSANDRIVMKHLKELGFEVTLESDKELTEDHAQKYGLVYVSSFAGSHRVAGKLLASSAPVIYANGKILGEVGLASKDDSDYGDYTGRTITVHESKHPLAVGLEGEVDIYKADGKIGFVVPQGGDIIASAPDDDKRAVICAFEKGTKNMIGQPVPARRLYFNLTGGEEINRTDDGWKLFDAAVRWATDKG
ncbi:hypothetical protein [Paenibacillus hexagrammi]|uniref:Uncharacterized protein n=1 Tax=Paenibacillus hexagrammi TaxID=2908839 RepID=A0ABY3SQ55_9BACL|nr:hypothetical protein [Paenibacillus sp. YPD9-1]UJF35593.1 hypothetical protein L0M14_11125 [Paenibacillus sp. YPD9-1]